MIISKLPQQAATLTVDQALQQAIGHHQAGQFQDAERLYRLILQAQPMHPNANHNLGVLAVQVKQPNAALPHLKAAVSAYPNQAQYWLSYIDALIQADQVEVARDVLMQVMQRGLQGDAINTLAKRLSVGASLSELNIEQQQGRGNSPPVAATTIQNKKNHKINDSSLIKKGKISSFQNINIPTSEEIDSLSALFHRGEYAGAVDFAKNITVRFPEFMGGWKVLGASLTKMGLLADALEPMRKAVELAPNDVESHSNLANTYKQIGQMAEAEASYRRVLQIKPDHFWVLNNLGLILLDRGQVQEAEDLFRLALKISPDYAEAHNSLAIAHNNLGNALKELGQFDAAVASYRKSLQIKPDLAEAHGNLGHIFCEMDDHVQALIAYQRTLAVDTANIGLDVAVYLAILYYLNGDFEQCRNNLLLSEPVVEKTDNNHKNVRSYWLYLDKLLFWHLRFNQNHDKNQGLKSLYVLGESHSLSAHGMVVRYKDQEMLCSAEWISGCKQWHLGGSKPNRYKYKFESIMARLPANSTVLLLIGEIDCRHDEGVLKAAIKYPDKTLVELIQATIDAYLGYVADIAAQVGHKVIIGGVPAINVFLNELPVTVAEQLVQAVRIFNDTLKHQALASEMDFLDVYALTDRGDGIASGVFHIDNHHLLPSAIVKAFNKYLIRGDTVPDAIIEDLRESDLPSDAEKSALISMFLAARYPEAEILAKSIIEHHPCDGFGWKVLGAIFQQVGRISEALVAVQNAALLSPDDSEVHNNLGVVLQNMQLAVAAEASYRRAVEINPDYAEAQSNLGSILLTLGRLAESEASYRQALQVNENYVEAHYNLGITLKCQGRLDEAEASYRKALHVNPDYAAAHSNLGGLLKEQGRLLEAEVSYRRVLEVSPNVAENHYNLGIILQDMGRLDEAEGCYRQALKIRPDYAEAHGNLGNVLQEAGRLSEAEASYRRVLEIKPDYAVAYNNLGITLQELDRLNEAEVSYRKALQLNLDYAEAYSNLGNTLQNMARFDEAEANYRKALLLSPELAEAHYNLGNTLQCTGRLDEAEGSYQRALQIRPGYVDALGNLALLHNTRDKPEMALRIIKQSLRIKETKEAKNIFVSCIKRLCVTRDDSEIRADIARALTEPWGRPSDMARTGIELVKQNSVIGECIAKATSEWPFCLSAQDLFGLDGFTSFSDDLLLKALLESAPICDIQMEYFLTMARHAMLDSVDVSSAEVEVDAGFLSFYSALARQCFINEYVFYCGNDEIEKAGDLRDSLVAALNARNSIPTLWPVIVAAYFPLYTLPLAVRLFDYQWGDAVTALLMQQVREPMDELQLRASVPQLTSVDDETSLLVQSQYEEHPYPRWVRLEPAGKPKRIHEYLRQKFPLAFIGLHSIRDNVDILIAGCGTGQHSIGTAQHFQGSNVLAVDLSMSSLSYAKRKSQELGLSSIEYAQADLLKLGLIGRKFDLVESVGVLHHMADPWAGWQVLLSLLRPGGVMRLGFYSEIARRNIVRMRAFIAEQGYGSTTDDIRKCRQDLAKLDMSGELGSIIKSPDFFSISACRDLLFHVQEHRMTLTDIEAFLRGNNLAFLGFEIEPHVLYAYKKRFPEDPSATNLGKWQIYEDENPDTFFGMYQFWIQMPT